jgi:hypothetical protein
MAVLTVVLYRLVVQGWMEGIPPDVLFHHTCSRP